MLYAQDSIDTEIAQIMKAPPQERVKLMNQLKSKIAAMNEQERSAAIKNMQSGMSTMSNESGQMGHSAAQHQNQQQINGANQLHRQNRR
jgi:hypothetical protein